MVTFEKLALSPQQRLQTCLSAVLEAGGSPQVGGGFMFKPMGRKQRCHFSVSTERGAPCAVGEHRGVVTVRKALRSTLRCRQHT